MSDKEQKLNLSEHVETLFEGVADVTDAQKEKMETVLEAAVSSIVSAEKTKIQEAADAEVAQLVEAKTTELNETVSKYMDYVITEWMEQNKLAVENGLKLEMATNFFEGMKALFVEHNVEVPEGKDDLVASHEAKITELEDKLNESTNKVIELGSQLDESAKSGIVTDAAEGLTDTQKEKFDSLVEGIEFGDRETFTKKVKTIRESYFKADDKTSHKETKTSLNEETNNDDPVAARLAKIRNPYA